MEKIEKDLENALRRRPAPSGFTARVLERVDGGAPGQGWFSRFRGSRLRLFAAAAVIVLMMGTGILEYRLSIRNRNEAALQRTLIALSIAAGELERAERKALEPIRWQKLSRQLIEYQTLDED